MAVAEVAPVELVIERRCQWKKKPKLDGKRRLGCERCGEAKLHPDHIGAPPSMNNHSIDRQAFAAEKEAWHRAFAEALVESGLPRGLEVVTVEVQIGFSQYRERDEGNHRWMIEKAFGDTLVHGYIRSRTVNKQTVHETVIAGGWLADDSFWPTRRYSMGNLEGVHTPGRSFTRLLVFPSMAPPEAAPRRGGEVDEAQESLLLDG